MENEIQLPPAQEYLVSDVRKTRRHLAIAEAISGLFLFVGGVLFWVFQFISLGASGIGSLFSETLGTAIVYILVFGVPAILGLVAFIMAILGGRNGAKSILYLSVAVIAAGYLYQYLGQNVIGASSITPSAIFYTAFLGLGVLAGLVAFILSFVKAKSVSLAAFTVGLGIFALLQTISSWVLSLLVAGGAFAEAPGDVELLLTFLVYLILVLAVPAIVSVFAIGVADRGGNVLRVEPIVVEKEVEKIVEKYIDREDPNAPKKKVLWVGRRDD